MSLPSLEALESRTLFAATGTGSLGHSTSNTTATYGNSTQKQTQAINATFDSKGLASITYNGVTIMNGIAYPSDRFLVEGYTFIQPDGSKVTTFGGNPFSTNWNAATKTLTWNYDWGSISCQYIVASDRVTMKISATNTSSNTLAGINVVPMALRFPTVPSSLASSNSALASMEPPVVSADYGKGMLALVGEDVTRNEYLVLRQTGGTNPIPNRFDVRIGSTAESGQPTGWLQFDRPIAPGATDTYTASLRFAPSKTPESTIAGDIYSAYAAAHPMQLNWSDRRSIAALMMASSVHATPTNPRGWTFGSNIDVTTPAGLAAFKTALLAYADQSIAVMKNANSQGMITWDIEGEQYPDANYVGDPRLATTLAPEMAYQNAIGEYFKKFTDAGFRVGVTIRANQVVMKNGVPSQVAVPDDQLAQLLISKIQYAQQNWGATLFYIDSTSANTSASVFAAVAAACPGVLIIPENKNAQDYSVTAPYTEARAGFWSTPTDTKALYPNAFSVIYTASIANNSTNQALLKSAVKEGDILLYNGWFNNDSSALTKAAYTAAGA